LFEEQQKICFYILLCAFCSCTISEVLVRFSSSVATKLVWAFVAPVLVMILLSFA
jgi:hypothetical protein